MGDEDDVAVAGLNGGDRVADVHQERAAADGGAVDPARDDVQVLGELRWRGAGGGNAIDVVEGEASIGEGEHGGLGVQLHHRVAGQLADGFGFGGANDGDLVAVVLSVAGHVDPPLSRPAGTSARSPRR